MQKGFDYTGITVVFACHDGTGNFLFAKRSINCRDEIGTWDPGGGSVEFADTIMETLAKEIREEYCADVLNSEFMGYRDVLRVHEGRQTHWIAFDFKVRVDPRMVGNGEPHKADEIAWYRLDALPSPMHSQWVHFFELHKEKLLAPSLL